MQLWSAINSHRIGLFFLPICSPELDPVEMANAALKKNVTSKAPARTEEQMVKSIVGHYGSVQRTPDKVMQYFLHPDVYYAA